MPLVLHLKAQERIIINGAILSLPRDGSVVVHNRASLLQERQIMRPEKATTPARRIYYAIQCVYMSDAQERGSFMDMAVGYIRDFREATGSSSIKVLLAEVERLCREGAFYEALKLSKEVIAYEDVVIQSVAESPDEDGGRAADGSLER